MGVRGIFLLLFLIGCSVPDCHPPMVKIGDFCCEDLNNNSRCDTDEDADVSPLTGMVATDLKLKTEGNDEEKGETEERIIEPERPKLPVKLDFDCNDERDCWMQMARATDADISDYKVICEDDSCYTENLLPRDELEQGCHGFTALQCLMIETDYDKDYIILTAESYIDDSLMVLREAKGDENCEKPKVLSIDEFETDITQAPLTKGAHKITIQCYNDIEDQSYFETDIGIRFLAGSTESINTGTIVIKH